MNRLVRIARRCVRAFDILLRNEKAMRLKAVALALAIPLAWFVAPTWRGYLLLVGAVLAVMIVEIVNTAIEAVCDAVSQEFDRDIRLAKDCGSLAVVLSGLLAFAVWVVAVIEYALGRPV